MFQTLKVSLKISVLWLMTILLWLNSNLSAWAISLPKDSRLSTAPIQQVFSKLDVHNPDQPIFLDSDSLDFNTKTQLQNHYSQLPISFEANQGQTDQQVDFLSRGNGYSFFLTPNQAVFTLSAPQRNKKTDSPLDRKSPTEMTYSVVRTTLVGANAEAKPQGLDLQDTKSNYLIGNDPTQWHTDIPNYSKVKYANIYPGIDLVYYGNQQQLEYDFVVAPGVNPDVIKLQYQGAQKLSLNQTGDLILTTTLGEIIEKAPVVYQNINGKQQSVTGSYQLLDNNQITFNLGEYDTTRPLVIDPVLLYSTYLGGNNYDFGTGIAVDSAGNAYVAGLTNSPNFPTQNALQPALGSAYDIFVAKYNTGGNGLIYSTYLGGGANDSANSIAVDSTGNAYITGQTNSQNFPLQNALQSTLGDISGDVIVSKINPTGNGLVYSTFLGGNDYDYGTGIAVDGAGNAYVTGTIASTNFPTKNALQATLGGINDIFFSKISGTGELVYSSYLGGRTNDNGNRIVVDSTGSAYITGVATSSNFPIQNALQSTLSGVADAFVSKINATGNGLVYSTFLGGSAIDLGTGNAYITGYTNSTNFPIQNALQATFGGAGNDVFVSKLSAAGTSLQYSTYIGGTGNDQSAGIAVDGAGNAYVTGFTESPNFPTKNAVQPTLSDFGDAFVSKLNALGNSLVYSTFLGGTKSDESYDIAVDSAGSAYITGYTNSSNFPTQNPRQVTYGGVLDAFVSKISASAISLTDFNKDRKPDLLWRNDNGTLIAWYMNSINLLGQTYLNPSSTSADWKVANTGDFNNDGQADILWRNDNGTLIVWYLNGVNYTGGAYLNPSATSTDWKVAGIGDFNDDGYQDILWRNDSGVLIVWYMDGINQTGAAYLNPSTVSPDWKVAGLADFNKDGKLDILWRNDNGTLIIWFLNGVTLTSQTYLNPSVTSTAWSVTALADVNEDGNTDIIWRNIDGTLAYWTMNGINATSSGYLNPSQVDSSWKVVAPR
jgi:hypothetical protein